MKHLFNQLISFPYFFKIAQISFPYLFLLSIFVILLGVLWGVFFSPVDATQGEVYRIIYLHVPAASVAQSIYYTMVIASITYLIWRIKMASVFMISMAPIGAIFTFFALFTGAVWGQPTWGTWWVWDARLTSTLILLILYLAIISLFSSFDRRASTDQAVSIVVLIGGINLPIIKLSVEWWNTLHQSASITLSGSSIDNEMLIPLLISILGFYLYVMAIGMRKMQVEILKREISHNWVKEIFKEKR